jgi:hypothetical protein
MINNIKIQLVDQNTGYLDIKENTDFPLNFGIAEIRDITKRTGSFSKTIKLSGSKNNNILLNNYFDVNVIAGTFNVNVLQSCIILENNVPILENAYIQLINVKKVQSTNQHDQYVEYEVLIKDNISDFYTKLGSKELTDLNFDGYNHTYSAANVQSTFTNDVTDVYKYIMPANSTTYWYNLQEWLPGIYAKQYWDRIISNAGYEYDWSSLTDTDIRFDKLIIPYNGDAPTLTAEEQLLYKVIAENNTPQTVNNTPLIGTNVSFSQQVIIGTEIHDNNNNYDPTLGEYTNFIQTGGSNSINIEFDVDYDLNLNNTSGATAYLNEVPASLFITGLKYTPKIYIYKNGVFLIAVNLNNAIPTFTKNEGTSLVNGLTTIKTGVATINVNLNSMSPTDIITTYVGCDIAQVNNFYPVNYRSTLGGGSLVQVNPQLVLKSVEMRINPSISSLSFGSVINLNKFVPKKIQQKDFIKSICTMYNLFIDVDKAQPNKLIIKTRDDYYDAGTIVNWTKKLNKNKDQELKFLSELPAKKTILTYKLDTDFFNKSYVDAVKEVYGQQDFTYDNEYIKGIDTKEIIFSPTVVTKSFVNAITPTINGAAPKNNIRILYDGGTFACNSWNIYDYNSVGITSTVYPLFSHFDLPTNPTFDINFGICDYYAYNNIGTLTNNNLYNLHWRRTLNQINKNKLLIAYFDLKGSDINKMKLNDKIRIDNSYWNINKVIDYNPSKPGPTKVELISIDDELALAPFKTKIPKLPPKGDTILNTKFKLEQQRFDSNNVLNTSADIKGFNNNVTSDANNSVVRGDNNTVTAKSVTIVGDNNTVTEAIENVTIFGSDIVATESDTVYVNNLNVSGNINANNINGVDISKLLSTTVTGGTGVNINAGDNTKFDINVQGEIVDTNTLIKTNIDVQLTSQSVTYLLTNQVTYLAINTSGVVLQQTVPFTNDQMTDKLGDWVLDHTNLTNLNLVNNYPDRGYNVAQQLHAMMKNRGMINVSGDIISANGANLSINKSAGVIEKPGVNNDLNNNGNPNELIMSAQIAPNIRMRQRNNYETADTLFVDTVNYDNGTATPIALPNSKFTIHRIALFSSNYIRIQYGQNVYANMAEARANINTETYILNQNISENGVILAYLIVKKGTTNLTNTSNALFVQHTSTSLVSGFVSTLQNSYEVSLPLAEIITNVTNGAVSIKNGTGNNLDNNLEIKDDTGNITASINGQGDLTVDSVFNEIKSTDATRVDKITTDAAGSSTGILSIDGSNVGVLGIDPTQVDFASTDGTNLAEISVRNDGKLIRQTNQDRLDIAQTGSSTGSQSSREIKTGWVTETLNATPVNIANVILYSTNCVYWVKAEVIGRRDDNAFAYYGHLNAAFKYGTGVGQMIQISTTDIIEKTTFTTATSNIITDGDNIYVQITGEVATDIVWTVTLTHN